MAEQPDYSTLDVFKSLKTDPMFLSILITIGINICILLFYMLVFSCVKRGDSKKQEP